MVRVSCAAVSPNQLEQLARTATGGTLFLRGAGALSVRCQRRLARALDETTLLVLSTREALPRLEPRLEARLANKLEIQIPPLARHPQDIPELVQHFVGVHEVRALVDVELMERLCCSRWPGNVRELEQAVMRLGQPESQPITERDPGDVRAELIRTLRLHVGDVAAAATALGISRSQLYRRAARLGVRVADLRWHGR
jgi:DNA-binding NtrC family response regulator